jgi:fluoride ion exporter CrcB/FEX
MTTLLVGSGGTLGVLARYGISRLTLHSEESIVGGVAASTAGCVLRRQLS